MRILKKMIITKQMTQSLISAVMRYNAYTYNKMKIKL
jgi:hypothetical protein